jgi:lipid II:glycine glycyltransferase (peptidoglycan interpeptide bridge formation enzyme)
MVALTFCESSLPAPIQAQAEGIDILPHESTTSEAVMQIKPNVNWQLYRDLQTVPPQVTDYLTQSPHGSVFQSPEWVMATHPNSKRCVVATAMEGNRPLFAALVEKSRLPGTPYHYGYVHRGPVMDDIDQAVTMWPAFERLMQKEGICATTIKPQWEQNAATALVDFLKFRGYATATDNQSHANTLCIDLERSTDEIFRKDLNSMRRGRIRKAIKLGIRTERVRSDAEMAAFWEIYRTMCDRKGIKYWSSEMFRRIYRYSQQHPDNCICLIGWLNGDLIGGLIVLKHGRMAEFTKGGSTSKPMAGVPKTELLHWEAIQWAKRTGARFYDLGGITPGAEKGSQEYGINKFKSGFTKQHMQLFGPMEKVFRPVPYRIFHSLRKVKKSLTTVAPQLRRVLQ